MRYLISTCLLATLTGCGGPTAAQQAWQALPSADQAAAVHLYSQRCATCHGDSGRGDGPSGSGLRMPDFTAADWPGERGADVLAASVRNGTSTGMPSHPGIDDASMDSLLIYLRQLGD